MFRSLPIYRGHHGLHVLQLGLGGDITARLRDEAGGPDVCDQAVQYSWTSSGVPRVSRAGGTSPTMHMRSPSISLALRISVAPSKAMAHLPLGKTLNFSRSLVQSESR